MGGFIEKVKELVNWIGDIIYKIIKWFEKDIREDVENKTQEFLLKNKEKIINSENPLKIGKIAGQQKALIELQKKVEEEKKELSSADLETIDSMLSSEEF
jgi:hypothetical protein